MNFTKELADTLRKNRTIDWQKRDSARVKMRIMIRKLLKRHEYSLEGMDDAVQTVMTQCELWTDNSDMEEKSKEIANFSQKPYQYEHGGEYMMVAEENTPYGE